LLEESPSPALSAETRRQILNAAVTVGRSVHYQGAGTVEFIVETDRSNTAVPPTSATPKFYFLEVNTRLQVEHAVTEQCRGVDIVKMQILIAGGMPLAEAAAASSRRGPVPIARPPASPCSSLLSVGYSIEARVYAEDDNFMPCVGVVTAWQPSNTMAVYHTATAVGNRQGVSYDGLLCKVIVYATESRDAARRKLVTALQRLVCFGVYSNRRALINLLNHPTVVGGDMTTDLIDKGVITPAEIQAPLKTLLRPTPDWGNNIYAQAVRVIDAVIKQQKASNRSKWPLVPARWSNNSASKVVSMTHSFVPLPQGSLPPPKLTITHNALGRGADTVVVSSEGGVAENFSVGEEISARHVGGVVYEVQLAAGGPTERVAVQIDRHAESIQPQVAMLENGAKVGAVCHVQFFECGNVVTLGLLHRLSGQPVTRPSNDDALPGSLLSASSSNSGPLQPGEVRSPIPAKVVKVLHPTGSKVKKGDVVVVLESMKMERKMAALNDGVTIVGLNVGDLVQAGGTVFIVTPPA
jgi:acetyl/propionyl-CoA carboxylase alpha subunit